MTKKILILIFIVFSLFSCGKKGDPVYKDENLNSTLNSALEITFS